jgi:hypothetical protein
MAFGKQHTPHPVRRLVGRFGRTSLPLMVSIASLLVIGTAAPAASAADPSGKLVGWGRNTSG